MKVFISSVTHLLKDERNALPPFLRLFDHQPLRFEDFQSQDRSAREACLAGVEAADVYVLLLGPRYGTPWPDTGLAPTAEEFRIARNRGIPILVFVKVVDEPTEPEQQAFKEEVGHYVNGRLWRTFTDPLSLNQAVGEALKALPAPGGPLVLRPLVGTHPATYLCLAADMFGALVDQACLQRDLAQLLVLLSPLVAPGGGVAPAVRLSGAERVWEGRPADVGSRSSSSMRSSTGLAITLEPSFYVRFDDLNRATGDLASEMATRLLNEVRAIRGS